jgi:hypothetical protein
VNIRATMLALVFGLGCGNSLAPLEGDIYVLKSIAGVQLPAPYVENAIEDSRVVADTIALTADGKGVRRITYSGYPAPQDFRRHVNELTYTQSGGRVEINFVCNDTGDCIAGPHLAGAVTDDGMTIDQSAVFTLKPFVYTRVSR